eukprot:1159806-Pelagomonas_calceolata.AAC.3
MRMLYLHTQAAGQAAACFTSSPAGTQDVGPKDTFTHHAQAAGQAAACFTSSPAGTQDVGPKDTFSHHAQAAGQAAACFTSSPARTQDVGLKPSVKDMLSAIIHKTQEGPLPASPPALQRLRRGHRGHVSCCLAQAVGQAASCFTSSPRGTQDAESSFCKQLSASISLNKEKHHKHRGRVNLASLRTSMQSVVVMGLGGSGPHKASTSVPSTCRHLHGGLGRMVGHTAWWVRLHGAKGCMIGDGLGGSEPHKASTSIPEHPHGSPCGV